MSPRLLYLLTVKDASLRDRDRIDARMAVARISGPGSPRREYVELPLAA